MMRCSRLFVIAAVVGALSCALVPRTAHAYLDPGTGSYVLQLVIALLLGASFGIKIYWRRLRSAIADLFSKKQES